MNLLETLKGLLSRRIHAGNDYFERINGNVFKGPVYMQASKDTTALHKAYLSRVFAKAGRLNLAGIDRNAAGVKVDCLELGKVYTALLTRSAEHELSGSKRRQGAAPQEQRRFSALDEVNRHEHLVLLGDPGSGKSTFVNFMALCLAGQVLEHQSVNLTLLTEPLPDDKGRDSETRQTWERGALLPVIVTLRDFAARGLPPEGQTATARHLWQFIAGTLEGATLEDYAPRMQEVFREYGGIIFLDGLDEVPEADRRRTQIKEAVEDFAGSYPKCRMVVTSRIYAYQSQEWRLTGFAETVLDSFSPGQIRRFIDRWYQHVSEIRGMEPETARGRAELLKRTIFSNEQLAEFAERPLLLTLMASLHAWRGGSLPEKRGELYAEATDLLLDWWEQAKVVQNAEGQIIVIQDSLTELLKVGKERVQQILNKLAFEAHGSQPDLAGTANIPETSLLRELLALSKDVKQGRLIEFISDRAGLLVTHGNGVYTFPHRTFQEYLAACYLTYQDDYPENIAELARKDPNRWREVVLLAGAKAAGGAAASIWSLADALCYKELLSREGQHSPGPPQGGNEETWGALLAGQALVETARLDQVSERNQPKLDKVRKWLAAILSEQAPAGRPLPAVERALAGNLLAVLGDPRPGVGVRDDGLPDIEWREVPAGAFVMGSDPNKYPDAMDYEQPQHKVRLPAYRISRYPITNAQYQAFMEDGGYTERWRQCWIKEGWKAKEENSWNGPRRFGDPFGFPNHPVVGVSWYEAAAFCNWLTLRLRTQGELTDKQSIRLPSEAEWEKAARGVDGRLYPWGNAEITPELANYGETGLGATSAVGCFPRGASPCGCEDMAGNVWEWCLDSWFEDYKDGPINERIRGILGDKKAKVLRGGAWINHPHNCRCASRYRLYPDHGDASQGLRVVVSAAWT